MGGQPPTSYSPLPEVQRKEINHECADEQFPIDEICSADPVFHHSSEY
jgi:hypothetical protein